VTRIVFFVSALAFVGVMHRTLWAWLLRDTRVPQRARRAGAIALIALGAGAPLSILTLWFLRHPAAPLFGVVVFTWLALALILFTVLLLIRAPLGLALRLQRPVDESRRVFLARAVASGATLATAGAAGFGARSATGPAEVTEVPVKLKRLPPQLSGFTIAQITDLHVGPTIGAREVRRVVEQVNAMKPDLVALTGDFVDGPVEQLGAAVSELGRLQARHGLFFVTGNHEYYSGVDAWDAELRRLGIRVLRNERVSIGGDVSFDLAGIDDWAGAGGGEKNPGSDLGRALEGRESDRSLVLLAHQPRTEAVEQAVRAGVELQLSGHTHGGQLAPFNLVVRAAFPYLAGLYTHGEGQVFVSRGTGYWGPPLRLLSAPELARIVLT
jgi:predicted MPP superfamily phosphohydrolase